MIDGLAGDVVTGMTVAVGAGSRGLSDRVEVLRGVIEGLRALGAEPFVVPAMGSHGGGTADGQRQMLYSLGITEESVGAEIRSTMDTTVVATTADGMSLYLDTVAAARRPDPAGQPDQAAHVVHRARWRAAARRWLSSGSASNRGLPRSTRAVQR